MADCKCIAECDTAGSWGRLAVADPDISSSSRNVSYCTSVERAYAFPRVRNAVARLLLQFKMAGTASVAVCAVDMDAGGIKTAVHLR